jgi:cell wall-associated NlpC family hydrolase
LKLKINLTFKAIVTAITLQLTVTIGAGFQTQGIAKIGYSVQVGAFAEVSNAKRLAEKLQEKGVEAYYFKKDDNLYAVRFGDYRTWNEARKAARSFVKEQKISSYYIASPSGFAARGKCAIETAKVKEKIEEIKRELAKNCSPPSKQMTAHDTSDTSDLGPIVAQTAERFVGIPYQWGGNNVVEGLDCSAFAKAVYYLVGVNIPRTSAEQFKVGKSVSRGDLQKGDLVFFGHNNVVSHVGIYVGNNKFVQAPKRNDEIRISDLDNPGFSKKYIGAKRYL